MDARLTAEIAAGLLSTGRPLAALETATAHRSLDDTFAGVAAQPALRSAVQSERARTVAEARLDAIALAAIAQRTYYLGDPVLGTELARRAVAQLDERDRDELAVELRYGHALFAIQADGFREAEVLIRAIADVAPPEPRAQRLSARSAGFLAFHAGQWDAAAAAFEASVLEDPDVATDRAAAAAMQAVIRLRRSPLRVSADTPARRAEGGGEPTLRWAQALSAEASGDSRLALVAARDVMSAIREDAPIRLRFFGPDLVRIALAGGDPLLAEEVVAQLEQVERRASVASVTGVWLLCAGLVERDVDRLVDAVRLLALSPRQTVHAYASEEAGRLLLESGRHRDGTRHLRDAGHAYASFRADRDLSRLRTMLDGLSLSGTSVRRRSRPRQIGWESLSAAEVRVAKLVAQGMSNREIGDFLSISARTVETHLEHLFAKLGVSRRAAVAGEAVRHETPGAGLSRLPD